MTSSESKKDLNHKPVIIEAEQFAKLIHSFLKLDTIFKRCGDLSMST